ncbi:MAG: phosphodiesterase [Oscillospiraceae bacterium]|nr:phosphodiesterase [Oscillospiraceae bacterium]
MKLMIASDLHGSAYYTRLLLEAMEREQPDKLLLLGDLLYHGPRNDLPREYAPKQVISMLNAVKEKLLCVRGNCEAEVDQMVLDFPVLAEYGVLFVDGVTVYAIHGHKNMDLSFGKGNLVLSGHTHIPVAREEQGIYYGNPGSVSIPKAGSTHGYMILEDSVLTHNSLCGGDVLSPIHISVNP